MSAFWRRRRPLAYALGGGSAKGYAHIGVLKVLEDAGVRPDMIAGTSIGAVVGAFYAAGHTPAEIETIGLDMDLKRLLSLTDFTMSQSAFLSGENIKQWLCGHLPDRFEDLAIPFACVSTDLVSGDTIVHYSGDLCGAIRASISLPLIFEPVEHSERVLVDGGLTEPVPVGTARDMGAKTVVAVSLTNIHQRRTALSVDPTDEDAAARERRKLTRMKVAVNAIDVMQQEIARAELRDADVVIEPDVSEFSRFDFLEGPQLIERGQAAARAALPKIRRALG